MEGYVRNNSRAWKHALKRSVSPGQKIDLDVLYAEYGKKHNITEGAPFVEWLRNVKLKDASVWEIVYKNPVTGSMETDKVETADDLYTEEVQSIEKNDPTVPFVQSTIDVDDIVALSVRKAKERLPKVTDVKMLRQAYNITKTQAGKDTLSIMLKARIKELEIVARA